MDTSFEQLSTEEYINENRSDHDETYTLNLRVHCEKRVIEEFSSFFPSPSNNSLPAGVRWFLGGRHSFSMYLANASTTERPDCVNLVLASDDDGEFNKNLLGELNGMTLSVFGFNTDEWFYITRIKKVPKIVGSISNRVIKSNITFFYNASANADNMPRNLLNRIFELPNILEETKSISSRIAHWDEYLRINEEVANESQLLLNFSSCRKSQYISRMIFIAENINITSAHINSDIQLVLETEYENGNPIYKGPVIGTVNSYNSDRSELTVDLDHDFREMLEDGRAIIPHKGRLFISKWGDLVQIKRLRYGLQCFARGQGANPYLDVFLFDSSKARLPYEYGETLYTENLLQPNLNPEQKRAVEGVINSDDLYLIQGPPGTGKTTVIAEICYQNAIRGLKTLIASQTNLAVDNALGKLVHHPKIRALRKGNEQSVQQEGKLFTENNVIDTWLSKTAEDCRVHMSPRKVALQKAIDAESKLPDIKMAYEKLNEENNKYISFSSLKDKLDAKCNELERKIGWIEVNVPIFLEFSDNDATKSLISNKYNVSEDFIEEIAAYYKTRHDVTLKKGKLKAAIDDIRSFIIDYQDLCEKIAATVEKLDKKGEYKITDDAIADENTFDYNMWKNEAALIKELITKTYEKTPSAISQVIGISKLWMQKAADAVNVFNKFKNTSARVLLELREKMKTLVDTDPTPAMAQNIREKSDEIATAWKGELEKTKSEADSALVGYENAKKQIDSYRSIIYDYNADLPYGVKAEAIEIVCQNDDIEGYYKNMWNQKKDIDSAFVSLQEGWIGRLSDRGEKDYRDFKQLYIDSANVIGITCSQSGSKEFTSLYPTFDVAIIDEVSKATPPELILSVLKAKKIVLVGDHKQLPPMLGSDTYEEVAKKLNISDEDAGQMKLSLFEELFVKAPPEIKTMLSTQYRMHNQIMDNINQFYIEENGYGLKCGLPDPDKMRSHGCHGEIISENDHALWVDVPLFEENHEIRSSVNFSYSNKAECECIKDILLTINRNLKANGYEGKKKIGIISFYSNQVRLLENEFLNEDFLNTADKLSLRIGSVDRFQGIECPVVICSFVRNNTKGEIGFAKDPRRVNVALSRAQELSIIVGCTELFCYSNNSPEATHIYKTITQNIFKAGGERSAWDFKH